MLRGGHLDVMIDVTGYGGLGQVVKTLPAGFVYACSSLSESQVAVDGKTVTVTLPGEKSFAYTVTAPAAEGFYVFSGIIKDVDKAEAPVVGASNIRVGPHQRQHRRPHRPAQLCRPRLPTRATRDAQGEVSRTSRQLEW